VKAGAPSDPYLFAGYDRRMLHLTHATDAALKVTVEVDRKGEDMWETLRTIEVPAKGYAYHIFTDDEKGAWVRLKTDRDATQVAACFQYANADKRTTENDAIFSNIAPPATAKPLGGIVRALGDNRRVLGLVGVDLETGKELGYYELDGKLNLAKKEEAKGRSSVLAAVSPAAVYEVDSASVVLTEDGKRYRIPKNAAYDTPGARSEKPAEQSAKEESKQKNLALGAKVTVSSTHQAFAADHAVDGKTTEASRWVSKQTGEKWIALDLGEEREIACVRVTSGFNRSPEAAVKNARLQMKEGDAWRDIPSAALRNNRQTVCTVNFKEPVTAREIRLVSDDSTYVRIYELALYAKPMPDAQPRAAVGGLNTARVCREVATERDLFNLHGTFFELPARNAGGFAKIRPVATHNLAIHDYASYRGLMLITGLKPSALKEKDEHILVSDDGQCAVWAGVIDDLWQLGKPRGEGGPWKDTKIEANVPSDPYLMTGYDKKTLTLAHAGEGTVNVTVEVDPDGTGLWCPYRTFAVESAKPVTHGFPEGFNAYWVRVKADRAATATAQLKYE